MSELPSPLVSRSAFKNLQHLRKTKQIVIITGLRRCGKSTLLGQIRQECPEKDFYINFDDDRLANFQLKDFQILYELFLELYGPQKTFYFDEIQNILGWERFINRFDYSLKKQIQYAKKIYFIDQVLAVKVGFRFSKDEGRLLENVVFLELKRRGYEIYFHKDKKECDFILRQGQEVVMAIQVCVEMDNIQTETREIEGLIEAMTSYNINSGLIITNDTLLNKKHVVDGKEYAIEIVPVWYWLLHY